MFPNKSDNYQHRRHYKATRQEGKHEKWTPSSHHQKKNPEGHFILEKNKSGTPIATSAAIYEKWLHQYRIIVGKETPKTYGLTQGNPLPPIQMPVPPQAFDNIIANATIRQTERKPETRSRRERTILQ
jgi:hypothetical protein